jgi:hypothetical protein
MPDVDAALIEARSTLVLLPNATFGHEASVEWGPVLLNTARIVSARPYREAKNMTRIDLTDDTTLLADMPFGMFVESVR